MSNSNHPEDCERCYWRGRAEAAEAALVVAWDSGHVTPWKRGPSGCDCFAQSVVECGCGRYGTGPLITPNPYRTEAR